MLSNRRIKLHRDELVIKIPIGRASRASSPSFNNDNKAKVLRIEAEDNLYFDERTVSKTHAYIQVDFNHILASGFPSLLFIDNGSQHGVVWNDKRLPQNATFSLKNYETVGLVDLINKKQDSQDEIEPGTVFYNADKNWEKAALKSTKLLLQVYLKKDNNQEFWLHVDQLDPKKFGKTSTENSSLILEEDEYTKEVSDISDIESVIITGDNVEFSDMDIEVACDKDVEYDEEEESIIYSGKSSSVKAKQIVEDEDDDDEDDDEDYHQADDDDDDDESDNEEIDADADEFDPILASVKASVLAKRQANIDAAREYQDDEDEDDDDYSPEDQGEEVNDDDEDFDVEEIDKDADENDPIMSSLKTKTPMQKQQMSQQTIFSPIETDEPECPEVETDLDTPLSILVKEDEEYVEENDDDYVENGQDDEDDEDEEGFENEEIDAEADEFDPILSSIKSSVLAKRLANIIDDDLDDEEDNDYFSEDGYEEEEGCNAYEHDIDENDIDFDVDHNDPIVLAARLSSIKSRDANLGLTDFEKLKAGLPSSQIYASYCGGVKRRLGSDNEEVASDFEIGSPDFAKNFDSESELTSDYSSEPTSKKQRPIEAPKGRLNSNIISGLTGAAIGAGLTFYGLASLGESLAAQAI